MGNEVDHTYEEIRSAALDLLAGREQEISHGSSGQYGHLQRQIAALFLKRETGEDNARTIDKMRLQLSYADKETFLEVFWSLFREGVITLGMDDNNRQFPFYRVSAFGRRQLEQGQAYFFHDVTSYEKVIKEEIPNINETTLLYLKEAMQAFKSGCILSSSVMLGVATEHTFDLLVETIDRNPDHSKTFSSVSNERSFLRRFNKCRNIINKQRKQMPDDVKQDLDTDFGSILAVIRNYRNESGHPNGRIIGREQAYVLLNLFVPYGKKMYQLMDYYSI